MSNKLPTIIGLTGHSKSGKDLAFSLLDKLYPENFVRVALADKLKSDLRSFIRNKFKIDIYKCSQEQKELIRPIMISYGCVFRRVNPLHWVQRAIGTINRLKLKETKNSIIITDIRFENEVKAFMDIYGPDEFKLVEIIRTDLVPDIPEEIINQPLVSAMADYHVRWPFVGEERFGELETSIHILYNNLTATPFVTSEGA